MKGVRGGDVPDGDYAATLALGGDTGHIYVRQPMDDASLAAELRHLARLAFLICGNEARAQDAAAETIARVWQRSLRVGIEDMRPYMRRTLVNVVTTSKRRFWTERSLYPRIASASVIGEPDDAIARRIDLREALQHLPMGQRAVIVLRYFEDLSEDEIAHTLRISSGTVKSRAARGVAALRELVGGEECDD
jgi:RNA polymerase sigma factor (sigma-70 family)